MDEIVEAIKEYFKKHPEITWHFGNKRLNADTTIKLLEQDEDFRKKVTKAVVQYACEMLVKGEKI